MSIKGKGRQPWEGYDEYCDRVDREVDEAGLYPRLVNSAFWPMVSIFIVLALVCLYLGWSLFVERGG